MSKNQTKNIRVEHIDYSNSKDETSSAALHTGNYFFTTQCLPNWQELAEGNLIFPQSNGYYKSMSFEGLYYRKHFPIALESPPITCRSKLYFVPSSSILPHQVSSQFHQFIPSISSGSVSKLQFPEAINLTGISQKSLPPYKIAQKCHICGRNIPVDLSRHIRTHERESRFKCFYPRAFCSHKTGYFHRQYDLKKYLLHKHFILQNKSVKRLKSLSDKLEHEGTCPCGKRMKAREWLMHIMARDSDGSSECEDLRKKTEDEAEVNINNNRF